MKTLTIAIDLRSFLLGALALGGLLALTNFKPAHDGQPDPTVADTRRFQLVASDRQTIILDTKMDDSFLIHLALSNLNG